MDECTPLDVGRAEERGRRAQAAEATAEERRSRAQAAEATAALEEAVKERDRLRAERDNLASATRAGAYTRSLQSST